MKPNTKEIEKIASELGFTTTLIIDWGDGFQLSWYDLTSYQAYFETLGRRYGLLREFKGNGII